jgi:NADH dehydrogenase
MVELLLIGGMKVLLTGATGFVGREVLGQLHRAGHEVRSIARNLKTAADQLPQPCSVTEFHRGDVTDLRSLSGAARGCDAVIHLVGIISEFGRVTYERLHVEATRHVLATAQAEGVKRFLHMSALGTRANANARYHQTKWAAEEIVRWSGLDFTIFRPSLIYGPKDHFVNQFERMSRWLPFLPVMGTGSNLMQPVAVETVACCFVGALDRAETVGQTYDVCGPERLTFVQILDTILKVTGRRRFKLHIPLPLARMQAAVLERVMGSIINRPPPFNRDQLLMLQEDNVGDSQPVQRLFGLKQTGFAEGIGKYLKHGA